MCSLAFQYLYQIDIIMILVDLEIFNHRLVKSVHRLSMLVRPDEGGTGDAVLRNISP